jgi:hypothetical protein
MAEDLTPPYKTPAAFRRALTDRLRSVASEAGIWSLADLQRQFAYDRLLARLYLLDDSWILKGATAMLARRIAVRHTIDIDVYRVDRCAHAERAMLPVARTLVDAMAAVGPYLDPVLSRTASGTWCPERRGWLIPGGLTLIDP